MAAKFGVSSRTVSNVFNEYQEKKDSGDEVVDLTPGFETREYITECTPEVEENLKSILVEYEGEITYATLQIQYAEKFGRKFSTSTLHKYLNAMGVIECTSHVKPSLTIDHKINRLEWILSKTFSHKGIYRFLKETLTIHVDEKWFYAVKVRNRIKVLPDMPRPNAKTVHHKAHITKLMFLSAIGLPQWFNFQDGSRYYFDGKIGIWAFAIEEPCKRSSKNRPRGTMVLNPVSVTAEAYQAMIVDNVIPAIKTKLRWAAGRSIAITVQQDGAKPHTGLGSPQKLEEAANAEEGWIIKFKTQPAQSPDLNKNDLCFFASLQKDAANLKYGRELRDIFRAVKDAYTNYEVDKLVRVEGILMQAMREILKDGGGNQYVMPHTGIRNRQSEDPNTAVDYTIPEDVIKHAKDELELLINTRDNKS